MKKIILATADAKGERLDKFLDKKLNFLSRTKISSLIASGKITIEGVVKKPSYHLWGGEKIIIELEKEKTLLKPFKFKVNIIYEDEDVIVVDKPQGLIVHPPQAGFSKTLVNALIYMNKSLSSLSPLRRGIVHRLDKETSGVMVLARNNQAHLNLIEQFKERQVKKDYRAICWGEVNKEKLIIDLPLARDKNNRLKMKVSFLKAKKALTEILVLQILKDATSLRIPPFTGRMHQIRVHLSFLGYPVVGDKKYGVRDSYKELFLHSHRLGFYHPQKGEFLEFESPLPERFKNFIAQHR